MPTDNATQAVLAALGAHPEATVAELAVAAGVGRSTAGKALAALEQQGKAVRRPRLGGVGGREPEHWAPAGRPGRTVDRLARGQLGQLVAAYLAERPGQEVAPGALAKALGRSAGAVANALARLVVSGDAQVVSGSPRRYRHAGTCAPTLASPSARPSPGREGRADSELR